MMAAYPTARGSETDARKIVRSSSNAASVQSIFVAHILLATPDLADRVLSSEFRSSQNQNGFDFEELANSLSLCTHTRSKGGVIGWIDNIQNRQEGSNDASTNSLEYLDEIFPHEAREVLWALPTKPGDIVRIDSRLGHHLVQIVDIMVDVKSSSYTKPRKKKNYWERSLSNLQTYKMETMGCQMNQADSERMEGQLMGLGLKPISDNAKPPDVVILNTCSIRDHAEQKVYSYLGPHLKRKRATNDIVIIVAGCVAQQEAQKLLQKYPEVDLVMGPQYANRLGDLLEEVMLGNQVVATAATNILQDSTKPRRSSSVTAWVNVIYGCNERCAFCIVPLTRGVEQSRPIEAIVSEVRELVDSGYAEITLLGQNIDAYGRDMIPKRKFSDLLRIVGNIPGLQRLRFVTSHPRYMSSGVVDVVAETPSICECFHIPFQSGSNAILQAMGRGHTREKYLRIVDRIRARIPDAAITADVIVGFPGETEEDFQQTLDLMERVVFDSVNTAAYSPRPHTPAASFPDVVPEEVKQERLQRINALNLQHAKIRRSRMLGKVTEVLIEERNVKIPSKVTGRTRQSYIVHCDGNIDELRGRIVNVKIDRTETYYLMGTIMSD